MEKNTILAVVLSTLVLLGFYLAMGAFNQPAQSVPEVQSQQQAAPSADTEPVVQQPPQTTQIAEPQVFTEQTEQAQALQEVTAAQETAAQTAEYVTVETNLMTVVLSSLGGNMVSWKLKEHYDKEDSVDMILSGEKTASAFSIAFGGLDAQPVPSIFSIRRVSEYIVEFYGDFNWNDYGGWRGSHDTVTGNRFRLIKRYEFKPNDYMFELTVTLDGGDAVPAFNFNGAAYTLSFGPQIGPRFDKLDSRYDFRQYFMFINGKRRNAKINEVIDTRPTWAAISGKYFVFIAIPYIGQYSVNFSEKEEPGLSSASRFNIIRPSVNVSKTSDTYRFYLGPKNQEALAIYNTGKNEFGLKDTNLVEVASSRGILSPLERLLKWFLLVFYKIIPNYGIAIILLTLLVKILFFPLTKKGSEATLRMQALAPKIKELQEKHKGNPQKMNAEMAALYQKEGYNPLSGCLPMLLQIPIFIAMYNLFNNHFDLRGAMFIPGWIPDLSVPEAIWQFPENFRLPILGWTALRALPFIYVGSQLIYGKVTQTPGQQTNNQMKMMLYVMPLVFFFVLYNVPSGLLIYWIFSNILTLVQQVIINKYVLAKKAQAVPEPVIAPGKKKNTTFKKR
jgi:YidC/Oxa1 family membrane protein insertase